MVENSAIAGGNHTDTTQIDLQTNIIDTNEVGEYDITAQNEDETGNPVQEDEDLQNVPIDDRRFGETDDSQAETDGQLTLGLDGKAVSNVEVAGPVKTANIVGEHEATKVRNEDRSATPVNDDAALPNVSADNRRLGETDNSQAEEDLTFDIDENAADVGENTTPSSTMQINSPIEGTETAVGENHAVFKVESDTDIVPTPEFVNVTERGIKQENEEDRNEISSMLQNTCLEYEEIDEDLSIQLGVVPPPLSSQLSMKRNDPFSGNHRYEENVSAQFINSGNFNTMPKY